MGALDDLLQPKPQKPSALDALIAQPQPAAPPPSPAPSAQAAPRPAHNVPTGDAATDAKPYAAPKAIPQPSYMEQARQAASGAFGNLTGHTSDEALAGETQAERGRQQIGSAFRPKPEEQGFFNGMKRDVTELLPGVGNYLMGSARSAIAPVTGAFGSEADAVTEVTGSRDTGERVANVTGLFGVGEAATAAKAMAGLSDEAKASTFLKQIASDTGAAKAAEGPLAAASPGAPPPPPGQVRMAPRTSVAPEVAAGTEAVDTGLREALGVKPGDARGLIRQKVGEGDRRSKATAAQLEPFMQLANSKSPEELAGLKDYIENRSKAPGEGGGRTIDPALQPVADTLRSAMKEREAALEASSPTAKMKFIEDYFPHQYTDPERARQFFSGFGGKQGSGAATKTRKYPTEADAVAAGLVPKYANPLEAATMYTANMDRYIAINEVVATARAEGTVKYLSPGKQPEGWVELKGRLGQKSTPVGEKKAYAPAEWARDYNNFVSRGFHDIDPKLGNFMDNARAVTNATTFMELSFSGYHVMTMAAEAVTGEVAKAVGEIAGLRPDLAIKSLANATFAPVTNAMRGDKGLKIYTGLSPGTKADRELVDLLTGANLRMSGMDKTLHSSAAGSYFTAWRRGALKMQLMEDAKGVKGPISLVTKAAKQIGRVAETVQKPIFEYYIPRIKNGAAMGLMKSWLEMNQGATAEEKLTAARKIVDSIDNRFGEMNQDNIFANQVLKHSAQTILRSYSWDLGTVREIAGGMLDTAKSVGKSLSPKSEQWSPRSAYVVGLPMAFGYVNAVAQYLMTGKPPESWQDLVAPRTGGTNPDTGQEARASLPSYMKDVFGWYENAGNPLKYAYGKLNTPLHVATEVGMNEDWRRDPIRGNDPSQWLSNYLDYVVKMAGPISLKQAAQGEKNGSGVTPAMQSFGIRPAPQYLEDPQGYKNMMDGISRKAWEKKQRHDTKTKSQYGGTQ